MQEQVEEPIDQFEAEIFREVQLIPLVPLTSFISKEKEENTGRQQLMMMQPQPVVQQSAHISFQSDIKQIG